MHDEWQDVELSTGVVLRVRPMPPLRLRTKIGARIPLPLPPRKEIPVEIPGGVPVVLWDVDDIEFLRAYAEAEEQRAQMISDFTWVWSVDIPDPPREWRKKAGLEQWLEPDEFRKGEDGQKLDYLEYVLLDRTTDNNAMSRVVLRAEEPTEAEIGAAQESFRSDVPGEATPPTTD